MTISKEKNNSLAFQNASIRKIRSTLTRSYLLSLEAYIDHLVRNFMPTTNLNNLNSMGWLTSNILIYSKRKVITF